MHGEVKCECYCEKNNRESIYFNKEKDIQCYKKRYTIKHRRISNPNFFPALPTFCWQCWT